MGPTERQFRVFADLEELSRAAADEFLRAVNEDSAPFRIALSGGSTPKRLYRLLASAQFRDKLPGRRLHFFWGDERHVPPTHPDSNYRMAYEEMLSKVPVPSENIHRIHGEDPDPHRAARVYEDELRRAFNIGQQQLPRFDLVLLGLGADGHTASLFPGSSEVEGPHQLVSARWVPKLNQFRITLTLPVLNAAALVLFLVAGEDKAEALCKVLQPTSETDPLPAQRIRPSDGTVKWLVDRSAARLCKGA